MICGERLFVARMKKKKIKRKKGKGKRGENFLFEKKKK